MNRKETKFKKVLLVDDEYYILELLQEIIDWEFYGFQIVGTAENARDAIKIVTQTDPDIIITDICMNGVSGIEFITQIRLQNSTAKIIILSAHDNFEYAQKALRLNVNGYLLKPVKKEELINTLVDIQNKLNSKNEYHDQIKYLKNSLNTLQKKYLEEQLIWIYKNGTKSETIDIGMPGYWVVASIQILKKDKVDFLEREINKLTEAESYLLFLGNNLYSLMLYSSNQNLNQINALTEKIKNNFCKNENFLLCGISNSEESDELSQICENSRNALNMLFYMDRKYFINSSRVKAMDETGNKDGFNQEQFMLWIVSNDLVRCRAFFQDYLEKCATANKNKIHVIQLFSQCVESIKSFIPKGEKSLEIESLMEQADNAFRSSQVLDLFYNCLTLIDRESLNFKKSGIIKANAQNYIRENCFNENFSMDLLAEYLHISKSYLYKLYKDETDESLWNFVIRIRIAKAKEMLINTNATNYEITKTIGYTSEYHFSRAFSKIVGVSPSTYKKMYLKIK